MSEVLQKMDQVFVGERRHEVMETGEAVALIGATIRKAATVEGESQDYIKAVMQRAFLLTQCVAETLAKSDEEQVFVPIDLALAVRKDAEGPDGEMLPVSKAMEIVGRVLGTKVEGDDKVEKGEPGHPVWGPDLNTDDSPAEDWGKDPDWSQA